MKKHLFLIIALLCAVVQVTLALPVVTTESELNNEIASSRYSNFELGADITLTHTLVIAEGKEVKIDLKGHTLSRSIETANDAGSVIKILAGGKLTISDTGSGGKITGGRATNGGGIDNYGTLNFNGGTIFSCLATSQGGGIRNNSGATVKMDQSNIVGCWAPNGSGIYNEAGGTFDFRLGAISGNTATENGAGIANLGTATLMGGSINNNHTNSNGGGIWNAGTMSIRSTDVEKNKADVSGGGLFCSQGTLTDTGSSVSENTASDGGGFFIKEEATVELNCSATAVLIQDNTSTAHGGGGITNYGALTIDATNAEWAFNELVHISGNTCYTNGGAIWSAANINMQGHIHTDHNSKYDIYLYGDAKINVTGPLTGGANMIGIVKATPGVFTEGYAASGTETDPFYSNEPLFMITTTDTGEKKMNIGYYECTYNNAPGEFVRTVKELPDIQLVEIASGLLAAQDGDTRWLIVKGDVSVTSITCEGITRIILLDGSQLTVSNSLLVPSNATLHIHSTSYGAKMGKLVATGAEYQAAIGGGENVVAGRIFIHGGDITANGGDEAAGIGGGDEDSGFLEISIFDGIVNAKGGDLGAGIGYGDDNGLATNETGECYGGILIYGGTVTAKGGKNAAGIGGGEGVATGHIEIYGDCTITAEGGENGSGIGMGGIDGRHHYVGNDEILIWGGTVTAKGGDYAAGIGSCFVGGRDNKICIYKEKCYVTARGGKNAAGIGGAQGYDGGTVEIYAGRVLAYGGEDAAGIGSGQGRNWNGQWPDGGDITISGGYVYAKGKDWGAGIGGGEDSKGANVTITGGIVEAVAGVLARDKNGCAIGSEDGDDDRGTLILGDNMKATVGDNESADKHVVNSGDRVEACWSNGYARIEACDHQLGGSYDVIDHLQHTFNSCQFCLSGSATENHTFGDFGECACHLVRLADNADNSGIISHWSGQTKPVFLSGRTLYKDGSWNTLCLPFGLSADDLNNPSGPLHGADIRALESSSFDNNSHTLTLTFSQGSLNFIEAGKPYIVRWLDDAGEPIQNPMFLASINSGLSPFEDECLTFKGIYAPVSLEKDDTKKLFLGANNMLYYPSAALTINSFRCYFELLGDLTAGDVSTSDDDTSSSKSIRVFRINVGEETIETGIRQISNSSDEWDNPIDSNGSNSRNGLDYYTLDGRRLNSKPTSKGVYIYRGNKVFIQ